MRRVHEFPRGCDLFSGLFYFILVRSVSRPLLYDLTLDSTTKTSTPLHTVPAADKTTTRGKGYRMLLVSEEMRSVERLVHDFPKGHDLFSGLSF
jgi:hypothetical protein